MTEGELRLLAALMKRDPLMEEAIRMESWDDAAGRWNSFVRESAASSSDLPGYDPRALHPVHGDMVQKAAAVLSGRSERQLEHDFIKRAEKRADKAIAEIIPYITASPLERPFTAVEDAMLQELVPALRARKRTNSWSRLSKRWKLIHDGQCEANIPLQQRLVPRSDEHLRSRWSVLKRRSASRSNAGDAPVDGGKGGGEEDGTAEVLYESQEEETEEKGKEEKEEEEVKQTQEKSSASAPSFMSAGMRNMLGWLRGTQVAIVPDSSPDPSSPNTMVWHWSKAATAKFNELAKDSNYKWKYDEFVAVWPAEEYGVVTEARWRNKNRIEKEHKSTGTRVKSKRKGAGEGNCRVEDDEVHVHKQSRKRVSKRVRH